MATIVVCHGAWSADWAWARMRPLARAAGHELFVPCYTGLGARRHLISPGIDLGTHIEDVVGAIEIEDLQDMLLVGHSYGGMIATGVADRCAKRVGRLVYLDAFVPRHGECLLDLVGPPRALMMRSAARASPEGYLVPPQAPPSDTSEADMAWMAPRRFSHPIGTFETPISLAGEYKGPRSYIYCLRRGPDDTFRTFAEAARGSADWTYDEIDASHNPHITAPEALLGILQRLIDAPRG